MPLKQEEWVSLYARAKDLRKDVVDVTSFSGGAHIGGGMSAMDILVLLYFHYLNIDPEKPDWEDRDRFVLSKGHAAVAYAPVLARRGFFPFDELKTFNKFGSPFGMHPDSKRISGCDASTGSLGHGLPMAVGMALAARFQGKSYRTYCLLGDGECNEGVVWEALMAAAHYRLTNLIPIIDRNHLMIDGPTEEVMSLEPLEEKLKAFGFEVLSVNGHDFDELAGAFDRAIAAGESVADAEHKNTAAAEGAAGEVVFASQKPVCIVADTVKGKGVDFMEGQVPWHYGSIDSELRLKALESIERIYTNIEAPLRGEGKGGSHE
ncbi:MAG: transketolase [Spirochaetia bacterium]